MLEMKNYREVGVFELLSAPLNPIGAFDAEAFKKEVGDLIKKDFRFIAVDLSAIDFLYSDAYNAFLFFQQQLQKNSGVLGVISNRKTVIEGINQAGYDKKIKKIDNEAAIIAFSAKLIKKTPKIKEEIIPKSKNKESVEVHSNLSKNPFSEKKTASSKFTVFFLLSLFLAALFLFYFVI